MISHRRPLRRLAAGSAAAAVSLACIILAHAV